MADPSCPQGQPKQKAVNLNLLITVDKKKKGQGECEPCPQKNPCPAPPRRKCCCCCPPPPPCKPKPCPCCCRPLPPCPRKPCSPKRSPGPTSSKSQTQASASQPNLPPNSVVLPCGCLAVFDATETAEKGICSGGPTCCTAGCQTLCHLTVGCQKRHHHCKYKKEKEPTKSAGQQTGSRPGSKPSSKTGLSRTTSAKGSKSKTLGGGSKSKTNLTQTEEVYLKEGGLSGTQSKATLEVLDSDGGGAPLPVMEEGGGAISTVAMEGGEAVPSAVPVEGGEAVPSVVPIEGGEAVPSVVPIMEGGEKMPSAVAMEGEGEAVPMMVEMEGEVKAVPSAVAMVGGGEAVPSVPMDISMSGLGQNTGVSKMMVNVPKGLDLSPGMYPKPGEYLDNIVGDAEREYAEVRANASQAARMNLNMPGMNMPGPIPGNVAISRGPSQMGIGTYPSRGPSQMGMPTLQSPSQMGTYISKAPSQMGIAASKTPSQMVVMGSPSKMIISKIAIMDQDEGGSEGAGEGILVAEVAEGVEMVMVEAEEVGGGEMVEEGGEEMAGSEEGECPFATSEGDGDYGGVSDGGMSDGGGGVSEGDEEGECDDDEGEAEEEFKLWDWDAWDKLVSLIQGEPIPNPCFNRNGGPCSGDEETDCSETEAEPCTDEEAACSDNGSAGGDSSSAGCKGDMLASDKSQETYVMFIALPLVILGLMASFKECCKQ